jgi:4-amino-4-deoxy-L-arabinose transferase-like glycosyltransferase
MSFLESKDSLKNPQRKSREGFGQPWIQILVLAAVCLLLFVVGVGRWDLWNPDEPRYAQVAKEMASRGDWVLMHVNGETYVDKPPLFFWLIALSSFLWQGFTSFSARFPSGLLSVFTVLITFFLGKKLYGSRTGFLSALVLATSMEFAYLSVRANIDATLTFFTTASLFLFLQWYLQGEGEGAGGKTKRTLSIYGFYVGMALATLTKGPVGFILPLVVALIYLLFQRDWKAMRRMRLVTGMILCFGMILLWYFPAALKGGQNFINETLLHHTLERFAKGSSHMRPIYYFFLNFPIDFLPWFLFLPGAIAYGFSKKNDGASRQFAFLFIWFVSIFLFFTFSKGKRELYLLPLYPAASLIVGRFWEDYLSRDCRESARETWIRFPCTLLMLLFLVIGVVFYVVPFIAGMSIQSSSPGWLKTVVKGATLGTEYFPYENMIPLVFLFVGSSILLFLAQRLNYKSIVFGLIVATVGIGFFYGSRFIFPLVNPYKSARFISAEVSHIVRPGEKVAMFGDFGSAGTAPYNFYSGIVPILEMEKDTDFVALFRSSERVFCLLRSEDYEILSKKYPDLPLRLVVHRGVGSKDMVLVSNR